MDQYPAIFGRLSLKIFFGIGPRVPELGPKMWSKRPFFKEEEEFSPSVTKWKSNAFLGKRLNRFLKFLYQVKAVDPVHVNMFSDFAYSPRGGQTQLFNLVAKQ